MALSQKGAVYDYRDHITDPHVKGALDHLASQIAAARAQGNFGLNGSPPAPNPPSALTVTVSAGIFTARIADANATSGTRYLLEWATAANFSNAVGEDLGTTSWQRQLTGQKLCFRVAARVGASPLSGWTYLGSAAAPTFLQG